MKRYFPGYFIPTATSSQGDILRKGINAWGPGLQRKKKKKNYLGKEKGLKIYSQKERGKEWISGDFATI